MRTCTSVILRIAAIGVLGALARPATAQHSVSYQMTPAHSGAIDFLDGFEVPFQKVWSRNLHGPVSLPIIANGKVFVTTSKNWDGDYGTNLFALDAATGQTLWRKSIPGTYFWSGAAYDEGRLFVLNYDGLLRAFESETGSKLWEKQLPVQYIFRAPPTVSGGRLYIIGGGVGGTVYAVDSVQGDIVWSQDIFAGLSGPPTLSMDGLFVNTGCRVYQFDTLTGGLRWTFERPCLGPEQYTPVYYADRLYVRKRLDGTSSLDAFVYSGLDGTQIQRIRDVVAPPAFRGGIGYFASSRGLTARSVVTHEVLWRFNNPFGRLALPPVVVNGKVLAVSPEGYLLVFDGTSGKELQRISLGTQAPLKLEGSAAPLAGIGAGEAMVIVPAGDYLIAFKDATH
jgi:outer membrane protein assembly factor BamB